MKLEVSAGIIRRADGSILVCKRGEGRRNAHLWEFPGGKREQNETACACLERELMEELHLPVTGVRPVCEREEEGIRFTFLSCRTEGEPVLTEHEEARFVSPRAMLALPFCPADEPVARALALNEPPLRHFFWDFDGTLMDTYPAMSRTLVRAAASLGVNVTTARALDLLKGCLADAISEVARSGGVKRDELDAAWRRENALMDASALQPVRGIPQALARLSAMGGRHYLVTHRDRSALDMLEKAGLMRYFTDAVTSEDGFARKPAPDSCLHLLRRHTICPAEAVMIGDRPLDTAAGRAAGILSCLLDEDGRFSQDGCELRAASALELPDVLCPALPGD